MGAMDKHASHRIEQLTLFEEPEKPKQLDKRKYKSNKRVIEVITKFQSNFIDSDDKQFAELKLYLKKYRDSAELIAYVNMPFPNNRCPSIIFREGERYHLAWATDHELDVINATGRKSMWSMVTLQWNWVSDEEMKRCILWIDRNVTDDNHKWTGIYKDALGNNWCWFKSRGIFS